MWYFVVVAEMNRNQEITIRTRIAVPAKRSEVIALFYVGDSSIIPRKYVYEEEKDLESSEWRGEACEVPGEMVGPKLAKLVRENVCNGCRVKRKCDRKPDNIDDVSVMGWVIHNGDRVKGNDLPHECKWMKTAEIILSLEVVERLFYDF